MCVVCGCCVVVDLMDDVGFLWCQVGCGGLVLCVDDCCGIEVICVWVVDYVVDYVVQFVVCFEYGCVQYWQFVGKQNCVVCFWVGVYCVWLCMVECVLYDQVVCWCIGGDVVEVVGKVLCFYQCFVVVV